MHGAGRLQRSTLAAFALPAVMQGFVAQPIYLLLQGVYAKHTTLALAALGTAVLVVRVFDAVIDPLIGWLSDRWYARSGSRKPWLLAGAAVSLLGLWQLYRPAADVSLPGFTTWYMTAFLGWTMIEVPYRAWSLDLRTDYAERARIQTWLGFAGMAGTVCFFLTPYLSHVAGITATSEVDFATLGVAALLLAVLLPFASLVAVTRVGDGERRAVTTSDNWHALARSIVGNRPLLYFLLCYSVIGLTGGVAQGCLFLYLDAYLGLGSSVAAIFLLALPLGLAATPLWGWACARFQKHRTWAVALALMGLAYLTLSWVRPGSASVWLVSAIFGAIFFCYAAIGVAAPAILGDIVDYGRVRFGYDRAGLYFAVYTMIVKAVAGLGVALGLYLLEHFGFVAGVAAQSATGKFGVHFTISYLPALGLVTMAAMLWRFPLDRRRHAELQSRQEEFA